MGDVGVRRIGLVTVARSDYGIYLPILRKIQSDPDLDLQLIVSGMHLSTEFGLTLELIKADGFEISDRVEMLLSSDTPEGIAKSMGLGVIGFAQVYAHRRPDILMVLGDRFEMYAATIAALPFKIPVAHLHGGEVTEGAIDDALRHSMTKLSHLHFVSTAQYAKRIVQLGEEPWRIIVSGAPSLDNLTSVSLLSARELKTKYGLQLDKPPLLVTFHPVTLEYEETAWQVEELLKALKECGLPIIFTMPNADTSGRVVNSMITKFLEDNSLAQMINNLGTEGYFSLMSLAVAMVGNSSSGIIEAASFKLPVVNIGNRQKGRVRGQNVIDVGYTHEEILQGIKTCLDPNFRESLNKLENPYSNGQASEKIINVLKTVDLGQPLIVKQFHDLNVPVYTGLATGI
jgi:UDP-hydrolysing UDP-N-acetyl-D-glucosamine 2-epimerase